MNLIGLVWTILVMSSCATQKKGGQSEVLTSSDFKKVPTVKYSSSIDNYKYAKVSDFARAGESVSPHGIGEFDDDDEDKMGYIAQICYEGEEEDRESAFKSEYRRNKKNPTYWNLLGLCSYRKNKLRLAILYFNKALALKKDYAPAMNNLGLTFLKFNLKQKALLAFERAIKFSGKSKTPKINRAMLLLESHLQEKVENFLLSMTKVYPKDPLVLNLYAQSQLLQGKYAVAVKYYDLIDDDDYYELPEYGINYGLALALTNQKKKAKDIFSDINTEKLGKWKMYYNRVGRLLN